MNEHQAREQEQANTEVVDALLNKNVCERCGEEIKYGVVEDENGTDGEIEIGHLEDCPLMNI